MSCCCTRTSSSRHSSAFFTGLRSAVRQPLRFQLWIQPWMPFLTYCESVYRSIAQARVSASSARITAVSSMRLLVVSDSPPKSSRSRSPNRSSAPQPPGPGLPLQAPSV
jgi:hypothetical protein